MAEPALRLTRSARPAPPPFASKTLREAPLLPPSSNTHALDLLELYNGIEAALPDLDARVVQFVSAYQEEGNDAISHDMCWMAARQLGRRVLYVDICRDRFAETPGLTGAPATLIDVAQGRASPEQAICRAWNGELFVADLGYARKPDDVLSAGRPLATLMDDLRAGFDMIVLASPPAYADPLATVLARIVDGNVIVVEAERTRRPAINRLKDLLAGAGSPVLGVVLNKRRYYIPRWLYPWV